MARRYPLWFQRAVTRGLTRLYRADQVLRRKFTVMGWLIATLLVATAVFGVNTKISLIYQLFGLALGLMVVAALASARFRPRIEVVRSLPRFATAGLPFEYSLTLRNAGRRALERVQVEDALTSALLESAEFFVFRGCREQSRTFLDRMVWYPHFARLMRHKIGARIDPGQVALLRPSSTQALRMRCTPTRRGLIEFEAVHLARAEPTGVMNATWRQPLPESLLVLPRTYPVAAPRLPGTRRLQPGGIAFAGRVGDAEEFVSLRDYRAGDTPRRIHWKAWARTGRLVVKEYQDEFFVRYALVLDSFAGEEAALFETAVSVAASFVVLPRPNESLLDLMFVERRAYTMTLGRGVGSVNDLLRVLAAVAPARNGRFDDLADAVQLYANHVSGAICVLLAWDEPRRKLVAGLRGRGIPVQVWVVCRNGDAAPDPGPMAADPKNFRVVHADNIAEELARP